MDKSSRNNKSGEVGQVASAGYPPEIQVDSESIVTYNKSTMSVKIRSLLDARLEYTGQVSGKQYLWNKAGSVVLVDVEDSEILLAKHIGGRLCCGNSQDTNSIFEIAD